tara:strand:- start:471 stop:1337 length:867 start_codon:yes stop_codon:yes gene_type:complete
MLNKKVINITELQIHISNILKSNQIFNHQLESQIMIAYSAKEDSFSNVDLSNINFDLLKKIIKSRIKGLPLSKIINQKGFWKHIFYTNYDTLDPRADSEIIIENVLNDLFLGDKKDNFFIDLCCGTGCLGISLLHELSFSKCDFIDISKKALDICKLNLLEMNVYKRAEIFVSDLLFNYPIERLKKADFIISNPPYIPTSNYLNLDETTLHDPRISLDGGRDGLIYYKKIINYLIKIEYQGEIYFEIDPIISENLLKFLLEKQLKIVYKKLDYLRLDRLLKLSFPKLN